MIKRRFYFFLFSSLVCAFSVLFFFSLSLSLLFSCLVCVFCLVYFSFFFLSCPAFLLLLLFSNPVLRFLFPVLFFLLFFVIFVFYCMVCVFSLLSFFLCFVLHLFFLRSIIVMNTTFDKENISMKIKIKIKEKQLINFLAYSFTLLLNYLIFFTFIRLPLLSFHRTNPHKIERSIPASFWNPMEGSSSV